MDPKTLKPGDVVYHPDFGTGCTYGPNLDGCLVIDWHRQGMDAWALDDKRWEQVELA